MGEPLDCASGPFQCASFETLVRTIVDIVEPMIVRACFGWSELLTKLYVEFTLGWILVTFELGPRITICKLATWLRLCLVHLKFSDLNLSDLNLFFLIWFDLNLFFLITRSYLLDFSQYIRKKYSHVGSYLIRLNEYFNNIQLL